ncbi:hypothetical protein GAS09_08955 [Bacteroides uniformis]|uniref:hypothetical protein n=1 Tax=Bacteroides uniformis TaxID=820 RepID=UPI00125E0632|nr:hypothetical protein [Bacteroides uniformis]KAB3933468.1 hypothetical protein GAS09_08955 [Bacteroides uniformis]
MKGLISLLAKTKSFLYGEKIVPPWWNDFSTSMEQYFLHGGTIYHQASFSLIIGRTRNAIYTEKVKTEVNKRGFFPSKTSRHPFSFAIFAFCNLQIRNENRTNNI